MKKGFVLYSDFKATLDKLPNEEAGKLFKLIVDFTNGIETPPDSLLLDLVFTPIKQQLIRDEQKWKQELEKRKEAGRLGGLAKAANLAELSNAKQSLADDSSATKIVANLADNVSVTDSVSVSVNENESVNDNVNVMHIVPPQSVESPQKAKHLFKNSPYYELHTFSEAFQKTKCFARHPNLDIELIHDMMVNSEAKGYKYTNWIMAAAQWVERKPEQFILTIESKLKRDPAYALMSKGDKIAYEAKIKRDMQRTLIHDPNDAYSY